MSRFAIGIAHGSSGVSVIQGFLTKCLTEILNDPFLADVITVGPAFEPEERELSQNYWKHLK